jgi:hypothetical protein
VRHANAVLTRGFPQRGYVRVPIPPAQTGGIEIAINARGRRTDMGAIVTLIVVAAILGTVVFALFEVSPFAHHVERYREPGQAQKSPRLD